MNEKGYMKGYMNYITLMAVGRKKKVKYCYNGVVVSFVVLGAWETIMTMWQ